MKRRHFLSAGLFGSLAATMQRCLADAGSTPQILLRSSWQTVNIGDIAHTPGLLHILEQYLPSAQVHLWPSKIDNGVDQLLMNRFPKLNILRNESDRQAAIQSCDFFLHGSGASLVAEKDIARWREATDKPYGVYGITLPRKKSSSTTATSDEAMARTIEHLTNADFVFFRDSVSLGLAKSLGCQCPVMQFGPDAAFACDLRDDAAADAFLRSHDLTPKQFLCCIPRLRYTPYWTIPSKKRPMDPVKHQRNEQMREHDHRPLRDAITRVVRETEMKILLCPEDQTQMAVGKQNVYDKLDDDVRKRVVWKPDYWLTGEAVSVYTRSAGLFGNEMHSPIMCIGHGIPAIVCRFAEQTSKGMMWRDIGLQDWLFDLDDEQDVARIPDTVLQMATDQDAAKQKAAEASKRVRGYQADTMRILSRSLQA
ncbi:polysaccharide pyruvyl transferase family protein [Crateriforma spongiae]|uniref:polysaccharide pyruvyl transferase family protein n=1 Tax=Crateriforma spongiae TaxID=2724528 RepID=UPI0014454E5D|nr:polysaccharide pyruvyl transferase family protein [Crateriforma spongiae]